MVEKINALVLDDGKSMSICKTSCLLFVHSQIMKPLLDKSSYFNTRWMFFASWLFPFCYIIPASANIGTANDVTVGLSNCVKAGLLGPLKASPGMWGGDCDITLSPGTFSPVKTLTGTPNQQLSINGYLNWPNMPSGNNVSLKITSPLRINCQNQAKFSWSTGTVFKLNTLTPGSLSGNALTSCSYISSVPPQFPTDIKLSTNNVDIPGSIGGILTWSISVPNGTALKYPALNLTFDTSKPNAFTMASLAVAGNGGVDSTPQNPPVAGNAVNCTAITGVKTTTYDFGSAQPDNSATVLRTSATVPPHNLTLSCSSGTWGNTAASAIMYVQTTSSLSSDNLSLVDRTKPDDWLGLQLAFPSSMPPGVTKSIAQNNTVVTWEVGKSVPLWTWAIPATSAQGVINLPVVSIQPQIKQLVATPNANVGKRTFNVTYSTLIQ